MNTNDQLRLFGEPTTPATDTRVQKIDISVLSAHDMLGMLLKKLKQPGSVDAPLDAILQAAQDMLDFVPKEPAPVTLRDAREEVFSMRTQGIKCPCCDQFAKVYRRNLNSSMASGLIRFYMATQDINKFHHVPTVFTRMKMNFMNTEFSKLRYWGLVEEQTSDDVQEKKTSGYWRVTEKGRDFALAMITVPKYIYLYDSQICENFSDPTQIDINQALGSRFNYQELMRAI